MLAYVGDGNNVARSLAILGTLAGVEVRIAAPAGFQLPEAHGAQLTDDPAVAANGADALYTDVWVSMGDDEATARRSAARRSRPTGSTTRCSTAARRARSRCTACRRTRARRSPRRSSTATRQRIWDQAENRRHAQKALLELLRLDPLSDGVGSAPTMPPPRQSSRKKTTSGARSRSTTASTRSAKDTAGVREQLARFLDPREVVVLTRDRVQEAVDDAVERGRMTRNDATALVTALFERGRTQTDDLIAQIEDIVTGTPTRIVREVDRARRAAGIGSNFPVSGYDDLTAAEVGERLGDLSAPELRKVRD